ncbi:hypothetical protein [Methanimicrococcus hacksteinii]|uniref:hypothetical protein n=1 Tax=Methanimicrococcus hacksteinii TaxID=3028293 RepID=UPI00298F1667|nr:hypothetical protein [Methanimicrococcus sp. At1]
MHLLFLITSARCASVGTAALLFSFAAVVLQFALPEAAAAAPAARGRHEILRK